jgi:hypothetical protein
LARLPVRMSIADAANATALSLCILSRYRPTTALR